MKNLSVGAIVLVFFLICQLPYSYCQSQLEGKEQLKSKISSIANANGFNGVIQIRLGSLEIYKKAFGYSDFENRVSLKENDQFVIGSVSKQVTAVLVMREYEKGNIDLDDKINKYLPELKQGWASKVTVHHLLTHTHGIKALGKELEFEPGSKFQYSQLGYSLLARITEKVSGDSFLELSTTLFSELGMRSTVHPDNKPYKGLVKGYEISNNGKFDLAKNSLANYAAAGSFISNTEDLCIWNTALHTGNIVSDKTLKLMATRYATRDHPIFDKVEYGYGLLFKEGESMMEIGALGYAPGFVSACYYYPKKGMSLVVLGNRVRSLDDFKKTFKVHTELMELLKSESIIE
ncbi:hypothetical protein FUAX_50400 (plasmid) [Fulvitalea axinellae]|uniref:Beta-lactamase-related domain-containing protein n=1 Tax=Fulvitalea axinellae TaxID=1182444 RepID=A0AAU9D9I5_9BACT|nr:hypothetical protein FUAX_50400 [Fulvitalea axinellae]